MILVFFEVDFEPDVAEELALDVEDERAEALGRGRDGLGKIELKGLVMEKGGGFNCCENTSLYWRKDLTHLQEPLL